MNRRTFVEQTAIAGSLVLVSPMMMPGFSKKNIGVQLYSVRDACEKNIRSTLRRIAEMGYPEIEGFQYKPGYFHTLKTNEFIALLKTVGLRMPSAHQGINLTHWDPQTKQLSDTAKKMIDDHAEVGVDLLICPWINEELRTQETLPQLCEVFNLMGERCKESGFKFGYHNHAFEFSQINGTYFLDKLMEQTDPALVRLELDLYWVAFAGEDVSHWVNKYEGRIDAFHVKDMANTEARETVEIGLGSIDFASLFKEKAAKKVTHYIVELEHYKTNSMDGVKLSLENLKKII